MPAAITGVASTTPSGPNSVPMMVCEKMVNPGGSETVRRWISGRDQVALDHLHQKKQPGDPER